MSYPAIEASCDVQHKPDCVVSVCAVVQDDEATVDSFVKAVITHLDDRYLYYELVLVDNSSMDGTRARVEALLPLLPNIRLVRLSRRQELEVALMAALEHSIGDYVITLDVNLDPENNIERLVCGLRTGSDVIVGVHQSIAGNWSRRRVADTARRLAGRMLGVRLEANSGSCLGISRRAVNALTRVRGASRFILYDSRVVGYQSDLMQYVQQPRPGARKPREGSVDTIMGLARVVISHSLKPLRLAALLGLVAAFANLLYLGYILAVVIVKNHIAEGWLTMSITQTFMFLLLFLMLTILSEYVGQILQESQDRPLYFIQDEQSSITSTFKKDRLNVIQNLH